MSRSRYYVLDELLYNGRAFGRGEEIVIADKATRDQLLDEGRISTTKPSPAVTVTDEATGASVEIAAPDITSFSDEDLLAEVEARNIAPAAADPDPVDYDKLNKGDLEKMIETRRHALEVEGTGDKGAIVKDDLVRTLAAADAALAASDD